MTVKKVSSWGDEIRIWLVSRLSFDAVRRTIEEWAVRTRVEVVEVKRDPDEGVDVVLRIPWSTNVRWTKFQLEALFQILQYREEMATRKAAEIAAQIQEAV